MKKTILTVLATIMVIAAIFVGYVLCNGFYVMQSNHTKQVVIDGKVVSTEKYVSNDYFGIDIDFGKIDVKFN